MPTPNATVRRTLRESRRLMIVPKSVARASDRLQGPAPEGPIDLLPQVADIDLHDVRIALEREVPDVIDQLGLGDDAVGVAHEELQQREFLRRQRDRRVAPSHLAGRRIEDEVAYAEHGR